ncbi:acetylxylan esterase [Alienimonas chondri]|uniref:Carbohydrate esterase n=1 Tax=Alienimonas chondri TaxID=2681879 RepID=A0ABX1VGW5_9PLAN|nr:acetylxylan esterase [Alienimonas chondri]NNJ27311.1 Carbohydrate esterase [Alienimonas chondri]
MLAALMLAAVAAPPGFNYDESKVPDYTLPDVLGDAETAADWPERRAKLVKLFEQHVYGVAPPPPVKIKVKEDSRVEGGVDWRTCTAQCLLSNGTVFNFPFQIVRPKGPGPVPVVVLLVHPARTDELGSPEKEVGFFPWKAITDAGYAAVALPTDGLAPDDNAKFDTKLLAAYGLDRASNDGERPADGCGALAAWGWGASRIIDHAEQTDDLDATRVAVAGHSRGGKAAWWAAARDDRFSIGYSNNSGCGGAALSRRGFGETVARINENFPRWFCPRFREYDDNEDDLPVDQHQLAAAIAPRAVYAASASEDGWADPKGEFLSLVEANPAFTLFGDEKLTLAQMPATGEAVIEGRRGYHLRPGGHGLERFDWERFLAFAGTIWDKN